jgi:5-methylcytosine-specific restriction endonuclease McrA
MARGSGVPTSMQRRVMREGNYTCAECGVGFERRFPKGGYGFYTDIEGVYLSIDHIIAKATGGTNERSNLRVLCTPCNTRKGVK